MKEEYNTKKLEKNLHEAGAVILEGHLIAAKAYMESGQEEGVVHGQGWQLGWEKVNGEVIPIAMIREGETMDDYLF